MNSDNFDRKKSSSGRMDSIDKLKFWPIKWINIVKLAYLENFVIVLTIDLKLKVKVHIDKHSTKFVKYRFACVSREKLGQIVYVKILKVEFSFFSKIQVSLNIVSNGLFKTTWIYRILYYH